MPRPSADSLFRPTALPTAATAGATSAPPVREPGLRSRGGNAMSRTRAALLAGAAQAVTVTGTRISMAQVATGSGVAKATLYNHFRTREAVLEALLDAEVRALISDVQPLPLPDALVAAAAGLSVHPVLRALAELEPQTIAALAHVRPTGRWALVHAAVEQRLAADGRGGASLVVRWVASFLISPADLDAVRADVDVLLAGLPALTVDSATA
jgi:AcrR family transcriptional regulator